MDRAGPGELVIGCVQPITPCDALRRWGGDRLCQRLQSRDDVRRRRDIRRTARKHVPVREYMDELLVRARNGEFLGGDAIQAAAHGNDQVGFFERLVLEADAVDLQVAEIGCMLVRKSVLAAVGGSDSNAARLGKGDQGRVGIVDGGHLAGDHDRFFGGIDHGCCFRHIVRRHAGAGAGPQGRGGGVARIALGNILRHDHDHRAGASGGG